MGPTEAVVMAMGRSRADTLAEAYRRHAPHVFRLCLRYGSGRQGWAEDAVHDVFVRLAEHVDRLDDTDDLGRWLYRVATNVCVSRLRRDASYLTRLRTLFSTQARVEASLETRVELEDEARQAVAVLDRLPPLERAVVSMKFFDDKSQREIARTLDRSEGYISKLLKRACQRIRDEGFEVDDER